MTSIPISGSVNLLVASDSPTDTISLDNRFVGHFGVLLKTHCKLCLNDVSVLFDLGTRVEATPAWSEQIVRCPHCDKKMLVQIQYYARSNLS